MGKGAALHKTNFIQSGVIAFVLMRRRLLDVKMLIVIAMTTNEKMIPKYS